MLCETETINCMIEQIGAKVVKLLLRKLIHFNIKNINFIDLYLTSLQLKIELNKY
jgi:hypothetical protein